MSTCAATARDGVGVAVGSGLEEVVVATEVNCPECQSPRTDMSQTCKMCGAPPRRGDEKRASGEEEVRTEDLEPYITLRYIAKLFKVLAVVMFIMLIAGIVA